VGPKLLVFPFQLLQRQDVLANVIEWQAPTFTSLSQRLFLVQLVLAVVALAHRPSYRRGLVLAVFLGAALLGARNIAVASLLLIPGMAEAAPRFGSLTNDARSTFSRLVAVAGAAVLVLIVAGRMSQPTFRFDGYPVDAVAYLAHHDVDLETVRMAEPDIVGNYLELIYGPGQRVFYDDRFDMFPEAVSNAHLAINQVLPRLASELEDHDIDVVLWGLGGGGQRLIHDPAWRTLYSDDKWVIVCRRGADLGHDLGSC
jgi:hypothetical protein